MSTRKYLNINESFICKIWEGGSSYYQNLITTEGQKVEILNNGSRNFDAGPDYKDCKIQIDDKIYSGDIEIHRDFQCWKLHKHKKDKKYNSVILQVILWRKGIYSKPQVSKKRNIPTVILSDFLVSSIHDIWREIIGSPSTGFNLPCSHVHTEINDEVLKNFISKLSIERLNMKTKRMYERLQEIISTETGESDYNKYIKKSKFWEQLLVDFIFEALGYSKNKEQMMRLSNFISLRSIKKILQRADDEELFIQALLFGYSGLLNDIRIKDDYLINLKKIWKDYKENRNISNMNKSEWQFFRMRPQNFPTLRIAYAGKIINQIINKSFLKNLITQFKNNLSSPSIYKSVKRLFNIGGDPYWSFHYNFGKVLKRESKLIGEERIRDILSNVIVPFIYLYSRVFKDDNMKQKLIAFYTDCKIKLQNNIIRQMSEQILLGRSIRVNTPAIEQGLIHLYNFYCIRQRCKMCDIGKRVFQKEGVLYNIIFY